MKAERGGAMFRRAPAWIKARRFELFALGMYALILVTRAPWVLTGGRFWAEEGTIFLQYAWSHSFLAALAAPHAGYVNLVANVAGLVAAHVPLEIAPHFASAMALFIQFIPAILILFADIPHLAASFRKFLALIILLVVPANPEIYLSSIASHFVLCVATGLVLVSQPGGLSARICKWFLLAVGGLSGVVSTFLMPLFWLQWWRERQRDRLIQAMILTICSLIQALFIAHSLADQERHFRFQPTVAVGAAYAKCIVTPLALTIPARDHLERLSRRLGTEGRLPAWVWLSTASGFGLLLLMCCFTRNRTAWLLFIASVWLIILASPGSQEAATEQGLPGHLPATMRYYYAAQVFFFLALLATLDSGPRLPKGLRIVGTGWLSAMILMSSFNFDRAPEDWPMFFFGPDWKQQVKQWKADPSKPMAIWPWGWQVNLPPKP